MLLTVDPGVYKYLSENGFDPVYGARPLRRAILRLVEDPVSEAILAGSYVSGDTIRLYAAEDGLKMEKGETAEN